MKCDEIFVALSMLEKERGIPQDFMMEKIVQALTTAYKKDHPGVENVYVDVNEAKKDLRTGELAGAEALRRRNASSGRMIFPDQFIPLFERNGFCVKLDLYMVEQACRQIRSWMDRGIDPIPISVNQSKLLFFEPNYVQALTELVKT